jgi:hypothetical protein
MEKAAGKPAALKHLRPHPEEWPLGRVSKDGRKRDDGKV